ncbi:MAG: ester cyclase [Verrucomicrobiota bacterium]|nr:ester cyclase [Verrucomicrobiota bacterium]
MTDQEKIELCKGFISSFNNSNWESLETVLCPDVSYTEIPTKTEINGANDFVELCKGWKSVMSDCSGEVTNAHASGDTIILEIIWTGTQSGSIQTPLGEHPSSGKYQKIHGVQIFEISNEKITNIRNYFDLLSMLMQFGAIS